MRRASGLAMVAMTLLALPMAGGGAGLQTYAAVLPLGDWRPTSDQLVSALDLLKHDAPAWERRSGRPIRPWREYRFQGYGIREKGRRIVYLNAFCSAFWDAAPAWREVLVTVRDGGNCFFQAKVDADSGAILTFNVNGDA